MPFQIDPETLDFDLPEERIAQSPLLQRDQARLLVLERKTGAITHRVFADIGDYLRPGDVLVLNKAKVNKSKLVGAKTTGGRVEIIFLERLPEINLWKAIVRPQLREGAMVQIGEGLRLVVKSRLPAGEYALRVEQGELESVLSKEGRLPLPPYIKRDDNDKRSQQDAADYQTVYATVEGSVAAPTAGLHFSEPLIKKLTDAGVRFAEIVLHVGWGTFKPIVETLDTHDMLPEKFEVGPEALATIRQAKKERKKVIAVGTTSTRTLESISNEINGDDKSVHGETSLFIRPGYKFRFIDALITNFHTPRSTPVALTAAFAGFANLQKAYAIAIQEKYRFYSYGDAMLVL